jgi:ADP-ribose pyrophosphatase YjhB (NUDIX family)
MAKSSKLVAARKGLVLLVRRRRDGLWTFPGGRKRGRESARRCLQRELGEELPRLRLGSPRLWRKVKGKNPISGGRMSDAIFLVRDVDGPLVIGDPREIDRAEWRRPWGLRLTPTSRFIRDQLFRRRKPARQQRRRGG